MKIKLDENMPGRLAALLAELGHDVDTVLQEGLTGKPDYEVWRATCAEGRFLITQDLDFSDATIFEPGSHGGILLVRLRDPGRQALLEHITLLFKTEDISCWERRLVITTEKKIRIK